MLIDTELHSSDKSYDTTTPHKAQTPQLPSSPPSPSSSQQVVPASVSASSAYLSALPPASYLSHSSSFSGSASSSLSSSNPSLQSVVLAVRHLLHHSELQQAAQQRINSTNSALHAFNFLLNYASLSHTASLHRQQREMREEVARARSVLVVMERRLREQESVVLTMSNEVGELAEEVREQRERCQQMEADVAAQTEVVRAGLQRYDERMQRQEEQLKQQEGRLERLLLIRFRLDAGVDAVIVAVALAVSRLRLLNALLTAIAVRTFPSPASGSVYSLEFGQLRRRRGALIGVCQLLVFALLVQRSRAWAVESGLHNMVGSYSQYGRWLLQTMQAACYRVGEQKDGQQQQLQDEASKQPSMPSASSPDAEVAAAGAGGGAVGGAAAGGVLSVVGQTALSAGSWLGSLLTSSSSDGSGKQLQGRAAAT